MINSESMEISIPPIPQMRGHIILAVNFLSCYLTMIDAGILDEELPGFIDRPMLRSITTRLDTAPADERLVVTEEEVRHIYASYLLSSRLLLTAQGEAISEMILKQLPEDHDLKSFEAYRRYMLQCNEHLIKDTEERITVDMKGFDEWKQQLMDWKLE